ncbi:ribonuclease HII [Tilletiopsis washingtonensis]|uniref:Ribonuclease n=1 Tax=Tilletiopsis washingtonensis TaxID=58919 RepID=A0A316ZEG5_9BASI|nr:ribonuclease HII [Tilletiopsis washingtonensis]PWN98643.1 ribonuclease HII [Tilletiopsis washingtonensis]
MTLSSSSDAAGPSSLRVPSVPQTAQQQSYSYASPLPSRCASEPCVLGVDEAGRGPVLGPLVYGIAYCPLAFHDLEQGGLRDVGFADSKALTAERRDVLLSSLQAYPHELGWAIRSLAPQDISAGMLRRRPVNLNAQSTDATVSLIQDVLAQGVNLVHIYVDTVGDPAAYKRLLSSHFPKHIEWTVTSKADALFPIVGAASIAAKTTRDAAMEGWLYAEDVKGTPDGFWETGSGYPGDPRTVAYLTRTLDAVFGWPGIVRFSWATIKTLLEEKKGYAVKWNDEPTPIARFFAAAPKGGSATGGNLAPTAALEARATVTMEKDRSRLSRDLGLLSVAAL